MNPSTSQHEPKRHPVIRRANEGQVIRAFGNETRFALTGADTADTVTVGISTVPPGAMVPPHVHHVDDEMFIILEGHYQFLVDNRWTDAGAGDVVYLPRDTPHSFRNAGDTPARHWVINLPSGFERFYARASEVFARGGQPDVQRLAAISREHGYELLVPS